jgi:hypothetical protein
MSKRHRRPLGQASGFATQGELLDFLLTRTEERSRGLMHALGPWTSGKKAMGKGAKRAMCRKCGRVAIVLPYGQANGTRLAKTSPLTKGDSLIEECDGV